MRESTSYCPDLEETEVNQRNEEWERYKVWRQMLDDRDRPESDRTTEDLLERLEGQIEAMRSKPYSGNPE